MGLKMKKLRHLWILILLFGLVSMSACGKPSDEEEPSANQEAVVNCAETVAAHQYLLKRYEELEVLYERTKAREAEYIAAVRTLEDANLALRIELALVKSLEEGRSGNYEALLNELITLRAEKKDWGILAKKEYEQLLKNYNKLDALYPPKHFPDKATLVEWRADSGNVTEAGCLGLQRLAFTDGYMVSVCPEHNYCMAIAGDYWYKIIPADKKLVEKLGKVN